MTFITIFVAALYHVDTTITLGSLVYTPISMLALFCCDTGKTETTTEVLRSILAQLEYAHLVRQYVQEGVPFHRHLNVPETHPMTKSPFCEREHEVHVLKVCCAIQFCNTFSAHYTFSADCP